MHTISVTLTDDEQEFLTSWEEVYKKGMLTYWVLWHLSKQEYDASSLYTALTESGIEVNEHSLYRMLRRFDDVGLIDSKGKFGRNKYFATSDKGMRILQTFVNRNIAPVITNHIQGEQQ